MQEYDFIVVGAGTSGCAIAARLCQDARARVLLLEAGGPQTLNTLIPAAFRRAIYRSGLTWPMVSEPEPQLANRSVPLLAGRVVGGSSSINGLLYVRGQSADFNAWRAAGCTGWGASDLQPLFERVERRFPLKVVDDPRLLQSDITRALNVAGYEAAEAPLSGRVDGYLQSRITVSPRGRRVSSAAAYLRGSAVRAGLTLLREALVTRILIEGGRAAGVAWQQQGIAHQARATREVIVCAGAYRSPHLLMLSGIGPADELRAHGIEVSADVPGVGRNLCNHSLVAMRFAAAQSLPAMQALRLDRLALSALAWATLGRGLLTLQPTSCTLMFRSEESLPLPDFQVTLGTLGIDADWWLQPWRPPAPDAFVATLTQLRPASRGWLTLRSADATAPPRVLTNVFGDARDREVLRAGIRAVRPIFETAPLQRWVRGESVPGSALQSDEELDAFLSRAAGASAHPTGTCMMGVREDAVVDPELRVRGIAGLRVADASIMPTIPGAGTYATSIVIGEKAADLIVGR
jgi:choline dehydrogenase